MTTTTIHHTKALRGAFVEAMSRIASTVSIVATDGPAGQAGATVSSLVSVSADTDRPMLLVCLRRETKTAKAVRTNGEFSVNVLAHDQQDLAEVFAGRGALDGRSKFAASDWQNILTGAPRLRAASVSFACEVSKVMPIGLHLMILGQVHDIALGQPAVPLIYANRGFAAVEMIEKLPSDRGVVDERADRPAFGGRGFANGH